MKPRSDSGYILASALAGLLAMSIVAAALVTTSISVLRGAARAEERVADELALSSAIVLTGAQLAQDVRRRQLRLTNGRARIDVAGRAIDVAVSFENDRLDLNTADPEAMLQAAEGYGASPDVRSALAAALTTWRATGGIARLPDDVADGELLACLNSITTVVGGSNAATSENTGGAVFIGDPAAGSRLRIEARLATSDRPRAQIATLLMTGDETRPFLTLDRRSLMSSSEGACHG